MPRLTYHEKSGGEVAVYRGGLRVGTIWRVGTGWRYHPKGISKRATRGVGETMENVRLVQRSLEAE